MANEKRLIDANAVENKIRQTIDEVQKMRYDRAKYKYAVNYIDEIYKLDNWLGCYAEVLDVVEEAPTVDAVEVAHGRWKYYHKQNIAVCTNCSFERKLDADFGKAISCPNCGAKMDGGNEDV